MPSVARQWLTLAEVADQLGCSVLTVRRMCGRGELRSYRAKGQSRLIRIKAADLNRLMRPVTSAAENSLGGAA